MSRAHGEQVGLREQHQRLVDEPGEVGRGGREVLHEPAQLGLGDELARLAIHGKPASIVAGVSRTPGRISRANARVGGNALLSLVKRDVGGVERRRQRADRGLQVVRSAANAAIVP